MPVPSAITDLSQTPASNYPAGSESPNTADDYFRSHASFIAMLRDGIGFTDPVTLASAATCSIGAQNSLFVEITGTTGITSFGTTYNGPRFLRFTGILTLTHSSSLNLPTSANITTAAGDTAIAIPNSAGNGWDVVNFYRKDGSVIGTVASATTATTATTATNLASGSAGTVPYQSASGTTAMLAAGTSGQFLKSAGAAPPTWSNLGALVAYTRYTGSTTHTKNTLTTKQFVRVKGGGGGGCSSDGTSFGGGGGEGEERTFFDSSPPSTSSITIGAGGTPGTGGTFTGGSSGGNSSYVGSSTITANGGGGGAGASGGTGGTGGSGGNQIIGRAGGAPHTTALVSGAGGGGVEAPADASNGVSAPANTGYGASAASKASATGGTGAAGFVEIWEFA